MVMEDYKDIQNLLKPRRDIKASAELRNRVRNSIDKKRRNSIRRNWIWGGISSGIAAAVLLLILVPSGASAMSPKAILKATLNTLIGVDFFEMEIEVRTRPNDNFNYINPECDFVKHYICVDNSDSVMNWKVDKGSRKALHNNQGTYLWIDAIKSGWFSQNPKWEVLGYLSVFLYPTKIMETELYQCLNNPTAEYDISKDGDNIHLTIHSMPEGDFTNPYMLNTSIAESECFRRYVIDAKSNKLISASVSIVIDAKEVEMIRLTDIKYGSKSPDISILPTDIDFTNLDKPKVAAGLPDVNAKEAAALILNSFNSWNEEILGKVFDTSMLNTYKQGYKGAQLIDIGKPFKSGKKRNITFVPYTLKLSNGEIKQFNLALYQKPDNSWIVSGGL